jgi:LuxR family maltose regulon positive regulatory protein
MTKNFLCGNLSFPPGNQIFLERPRLDQMMEKAVRCPVVTVVAGAGYGKSQAVYSFARKYNVRTTWVQFSEDDNAGDRFWEKFVDAVSVINRDSAVKLTEIGFPVTDRQFNRYMSVPRNDILPNDKYIFVYDDIHLIRDRAVLGFIERSIATPFPNITSIIIARNEPGIDLSRFESKRLVARITEENLRFSRDETAEYFRLVGLRPSAQIVSAVYNDTEGWAFATHLAGLSLKNSRSVDAYIPQALRSNIFRLIESEIISRLSAALRTFLIKLSLVEHPVPGLLREISGGEEKDYSLIDEMEQISSFIQYDSYLNAYRIHHLLLDYLRGRQNELSEEEKRDVWDKAARWCLRNNHKMEAVSYFQKAGDYAGLLTAALTFPMILPKKSALMFLQILEKTPPELIDKFPATAFLRFRMLSDMEIYDQAEAGFQEIIARLEEKKEFDSDAAAIITNCYNGLGFIGMTTCIHSRNYSFVRYFERARHYAEMNEYRAKPPVSVMNLSSYICHAADPLEMKRYNEMLGEVTPHLAVSLNGCAYGLDDLAWTEFAFFRGDLSQAEQFATAALTKARERDQYEIENCALLFLLRINTARGSGENIPDLFRQIDAQMNQVYYLNRSVYHDIVYGWFYIQTGRTEKLASWLKSGFEESDLNSQIHGLETLVKAKYHLAEKRYPAALADLENRGSIYGPWAFVLGRLEVKVIEAACRYHLDDITGALCDLESAWELAKDNGLYMPFNELGRDMRALAGAALKNPSIKVPRAELEKIRRGAALYAKNVFAVSEQYHTDSAKAQKSRAGAALSPRELDVLTGLSQGLTREEIALVSSISVNTVKSAARSVYNKLGAVNRVDAVRIAAELGIL